MNNENTKTILLVEDEAITAMFEKKQLKNKGYIVHHVLNGEDAIESYANEKYDLILMDIDLGSGIDGTQAAEKILREKDIPIVFLSSHTEPEMVEKTEKITSYGYVVKNSGVFVLDASIKMALKLFEAKSKQKLAEDIIKENELWLNETARIARVGGWVIDLKNNMLEWTDETFRIHELPMGNPPNVADAIQFYHDEDRSHVSEAIQQAVENGKGFDFEARIITAKQNLKWVRLIGNTIFHEGHMVFVRGTIQDITESKRKEIQLKESEEKYHRIAENVTDVVWVTDLKMNPTYISPSVEKVFGVKPEDYLKQPITQTYPTASLEKLQKRLKEEFAKEQDPKADKNRIFQLEVERYYADGSIGWDAIRAKFIRDEKMNPVAIQGGSHDITERKRVEMALREKNNITSIENLLTFQADSTDNAEMKTALQESISRIQSTRVLYEKLLLSKDYQDVSIKNYIDSLIDSLVAVFPESNYISIERTIKDFTVNSKKAIPIGIIINELMTNIFKYAFKEMKKGHILIEINKTDNNVTLTIKDNGAGIDERVDANKSPGFGLSLVKMLTEQLNGTFSMENDNGTRSVLKFEI